MRGEGELVWEVGGGQTTGDSRLTQVSFLGAPLPVDGVLYAIGKRLEEIVLVALNTEDGKLVWLQSLAAAENETVRGRYQRTSTANKSHSLTPSYSKGILVCPTGKSALVAVDTVGRRVLWGAQATNAAATTNRSRSSSNALTTLQNPQVFLENSRVVAFDISSDSRLLAVSLLDGSPLMETIGKAGVKVEDVLHVASVDESQVVLVEKTRVRAISSDSGRKLWQTSIRKFGPPTGRGYVSEKSLYLPTEGNSIIKIDLETGDVVDGVKTDQPLGNLILHQGRVISRRETSVACFELDSKVIAELDVAAKAAGGIEKVSPALKVKQAALLRNQGEVKSAIELLQTIDNDDRVGRFKTEFLRSATLLFESDPEYALTLFKEYESWFHFETDPKLFLSYVELLVKYDMKDDAIEQLFKGESFFNEDEPEAETVLMQRPIAVYNVEDDDDQQAEESGESQPTKKADEGSADAENQTDKKESAFLKNQSEFDQNRISFDQNHWAKTQLIRVARSSPDSIPKIRTAIQQRIDSTAVSGSLERHRFLRQFPLEFVAPQLRFELAEQLIGEQHVAEAENMLASLLGFLPVSADQIESTEILIEGLSKESIVKLWSKIHDAQYGTSVEVAAELKTNQPAKSLDYDRVDLKTEIVPSNYQRDYPTVVQARGEVANRVFNGKCFTIWGDEQEVEVLGPTGESEIRFKLFKEGNDRRADLKRGSGWIQANHSLAILRQKNLLLSLDLSKLELGQPAVIWKKFVVPTLDWRPEIIDELDVFVNPALRPENATASFPTTGCCCFIDKDKLTCIDAFTGATLWARTKDTNHAHVLANGSEVVTMDPKLNESSVFDLRTGERLRTNLVSDQMESLWDVTELSFMAVGEVKHSSLEGLTDFEDFRSKQVEVEDSEDVEEVGEEKAEKDPKNENGSKVEKAGQDEENEKAKKKPASKKVAKKKPTKKKRASKRSTEARVLSRYDASRGEFVWKKVFDEDVRICRLPGNRFAVLAKDNHLHIFESETGKKLAKVPSGLTEGQRKQVRFIGGFQHLGKDLIILANNKTVSIIANGYRVRAVDSLFAFFSGHLLMLSHDKLEPVWDQLAELDGFQLQPFMPSTSPLLILNRKIQSTSSRKPQKNQAQPTFSGSALQLLALDMNDGHVVVNQIMAPIGTVRFTSPIVDPSDGTVLLKLAGREVQLVLKKSSDEPPSPVASITKINPIPESFGIVAAVAKVAAETMFDMEKLNERLVQQAEAYEASLEQKRQKERELLEAETSQ